MLFLWKKQNNEREFMSNSNSSNFFCRYESGGRVSLNILEEDRKKRRQALWKAFVFLFCSFFHEKVSRVRQKMASIL
jgi:hypothetical protein